VLASVVQGDAVNCNTTTRSGADPASKVKGGDFRLIFGGQVPLWVHYCKRDEAFFITLL